MAFRLVRGVGINVEPTVVSVYASGCIWPGSVVDNPCFMVTANGGYVQAAASTSTGTSIFGVSLDYCQGRSDTMIKVIPIVPGQLWEADCTNNTNTAHILSRHRLTNSLTLANTGVDYSSVTGIFMAYNVTGATGDNKILGTFLKSSYN